MKSEKFPTKGVFKIEKVLAEYACNIEKAPAEYSEGEQNFVGY